MADLTLGAKRDRLSLIYVTDDPWSASLILKEKQGNSVVVIPWPTAPVIEFPDLDVSWTATLEPHDPGTGSIADAKATWVKTSVEMNNFDSLAKGEPTAARLSVAGETWWKGLTERDA